MSILTVGEIRDTLNDGRGGPCRVNMGDFLQIGDYLQLGELGKRKKKGFFKKFKKLRKKLKKFSPAPHNVHKRHIGILKKLLKKRKGKKKKSKRGGGEEQPQEQEQLTPEEQEAVQDPAAVAEVTAEMTPQTPTAPLTLPAVPSAYYPGGLAPAIPAEGSAYYQPPPTGYPQPQAAPSPGYPTPSPFPPSAYYPPTQQQMMMMQEQEGPDMQEEPEEIEEGGGAPRPSTLPGPDLTEEIIEPEEGDEDAEEISGLGMDFSAPSRWAQQAGSAVARASQAPSVTAASAKSPDLTPLITAAGSALAQGLTAYQQGRAAIKEAKAAGKVAGAQLQLPPSSYYPTPAVQQTDSGMPGWVPWALGGVAALLFLPRILGR